MSRPADRERALEDLARVAAGEPGVDLLDRALAQLATQSARVGRRPPRVRTVRASATAVRLDLAEPDGLAVDPFVAVAADRWELDGARLVASDEAADRAYPALVTLGIVGDEILLVDVAELGTLVIAGEEPVRSDVVRALAADLALGWPARATARALCVSDDAILGAVEAGELAVEPNPSRVAALLREAMRATPTSDPGQSDPGQSDPPQIVLADRAVPILVPGRCGAALITTAECPDAGGRVDVTYSGGALLLPDGISFVPQSMPRTGTDDVVALLGATALPEVADEAPAGPAPTPLDPTPPVPTPLDPTPLDPTPLDPTPTAATPLDPTPTAATPTAPTPTVPTPTAHTIQPPRVLVLGEVVVENAQGRAESTRIGRLAETAAFVLLNPGARPSELQSALWPGRRSNPQTCRQMISRTRTWLGRTDSGASYLMPFTDTAGRLRLRDEVGSDWAQFQALAEAGLSDPQDTELLTAALRLVRGRPFGPVAGRELPWADLAINDMICLITDAAHELAVRHERAGRWSAARDAALRGLSTESESEVLQAVLARVARAS